ncbi:MAG: hypothetical protein A2010_02195 [Nitrospirae bacterium GWD2_57_9]|nr:MAG: hypothetical protein A2010_02195 [Nitrospirae bacterium GWD2_57_9]
MMKISFLTTLRFKITLFITTLLLVTATLFTLLTVQTMNRQVMNSLMKRAEALSKSIAAVAPYSILAGDLLAIDNISWRVKEANEDIQYAAVTNSRFEILTHTDMSKIGQVFSRSVADAITETKDGTRIYQIKDEADSFEIQAPMTFNNKQIGNVIIGINRSSLLDARSETLKRIGVGMAVTMLLGLGCILVLSSFITKPIKELSRGVNELKVGRRTKLNIFSHDELGNLTKSFNQMTDLTTRQQERLHSYAQELEDSYVSTVKVLTAAIDARDPYTLGHSTRVAKLAVRIGKAIEFSRQELEDLEIASLFHDVGKLKMPDYILLKNGPLDPEEHRQILAHCEYGAAILGRASSLQKYIPAVRHHHEWFNGEGYPDGLRGDDVPLHAAIIAIADAFDAMTSVRPYKKSFCQDDALQELTRCSGRQFNPWLVEVFQQALASDPVLAEQFSSRG